MRSDGGMPSRLVLACLIAALAPPVASQESARKPWVAATYAYPQRDRGAAIQPLADYLQQRGKRATEVRLLPSPTALIEALRKGEVDIAVPNLHGYLQSRQWREDIVALPVPDVPPAQADRYRAVLVARAGIDTTAHLQRDAAQLRLALVGKDSASGGFVPVRQLRVLGLQPATSFAGVSYAGSHAAALQALVSGQADVAALAADVFDAARPQDVVELWRSDPIPPGPLLCRPAPDVPCELIAGWLLEAHAEAPAVMAALRAGWPEFGDAAAFAPVPSALESATLPPE